MSQDSQKLKSLVNFKKKLEMQIEDLDAKMKDLTTTLEILNSILLEKGFKRGDLKKLKPPVKEEPPVLRVTIKKEETTEPSALKPESVIPLKTMNDEPLAIIYVDKEALHVLPDDSKKFSASTPPFQSFLVERVLVKMLEKDRELLRMGQLASDRMFGYNIVKEGDFIREIVFRNVDSNRLKELKSSIRWTLEKMYEKTAKD